jgi:hypothetical protein
MNPRKISPPLTLLLAALLGACQAPRAVGGPGAALPCSQPGWGRVLSARETQMTVRAVEASAAPTRPRTHLGKPGWGRN